MEPRHFWWLVETLAPPESAKRLFTDDERQELLDMLQQAKREAGQA